MGRATTIFAAVICSAGLAGALVGCAALKDAHSASQPAAASPTASSPQGDTYASIAKLPDWSGVWDPQFFVPPKPGEGPPKPPPQPALTPAYAAKMAAFLKKNKRPGINFVDVTANCVPYGLPASMRLPYPLEFLFTPGRVTVAIETDEMIRRIYTDGRKVPDDPDPTYQGYSIGHWEGDTLVVDTTAIRPETSILSGIDGHSDQLHIAERMHLTGPDALAIETTMTDPAVFTAPYTTTTLYQRHRDWDIMEYICDQNNRDSVDAAGNAHLDLKRKPGE